MSTMFEEATSFNQDLCWELSGSVDATDMFRASSGGIGCPLSGGRSGGGSTPIALLAIAAAVLVAIALYAFRWRRMLCQKASEPTHSNHSMLSHLLDNDSLSPSWDLYADSEGGRGIEVEVEMAEQADIAVSTPALLSSNAGLDTMLAPTLQSALGPTLGPTLGPALDPTFDPALNTALAPRCIRRGARAACSLWYSMGATSASLCGAEGCQRPCSASSLRLETTCERSPSKGAGRGKVGINTRRQLMRLTPYP